MTAALAEVQASHLEGNIPPAADFEAFLRRDLTAYFETAGVSDPQVEVELLRQGATQSGIAYPKYYAWVQVHSGGKLAQEGAVRVAAIDRVRFEITDFMPSATIKADPAGVGAVFPPALVPAIQDRAAN